MGAPPGQVSSLLPELSASSLSGHARGPRAPTGPVLCPQHRDMSRVLALTSP